MTLPEDIKIEIRELFSQEGRQLSDSDVEEIGQNLLSLALHVEPVR